MKLSHFACIFTTVFCFAHGAHAQDAQVAPVTAAISQSANADVSRVSGDGRCDDASEENPPQLWAANATHRMPTVLSPKKPHGQNPRVSRPEMQRDPRIVVDRLTDSLAILESDGETFTVPRHVLPIDARVEGAVLQWQYLPQVQSQLQQEALRRIERLKQMSDAIGDI